VKRHVSAEVLALHREGEVSPRRAERITAHLSVCAVCTEVNEDLGTVTTVLVATQLAPMPEPLAERIQLAIAQEAAMRAATVTAAVTAAAANASRTAEVAFTQCFRCFRCSVRPCRNRYGPRRATREAGSDTDVRTPADRICRNGGGRSRRMPNWSSPLLLRGRRRGAVVIIAGGLLFAAGSRLERANSGAAARTRSRSAPCAQSFCPR
jgi:hypothetical protein